MVTTFCTRVLKIWTKMGIFLFVPFCKISDHSKFEETSIFLDIENGKMMEHRFVSSGAPLQERTWLFQLVVWELKLAFLLLIHIKLAYFKIRKIRQKNKGILELQYDTRTRDFESDFYNKNYEVTISPIFISYINYIYFCIATYAEASANIYARFQFLLIRLLE